MVPTPHHHLGLTIISHIPIKSYLGRRWMYYTVPSTWTWYVSGRGLPPCYVNICLEPEKGSFILKFVWSQGCHNVFLFVQAISKSNRFFWGSQRKATIRSLQQQLPVNVNIFWHYNPRITTTTFESKNINIIYSKYSLQCWSFCRPLWFRFSSGTSARSWTLEPMLHEPGRDSTVAVPGTAAGYLAQGRKMNAVLLCSCCFKGDGGGDSTLSHVMVNNSVDMCWRFDISWCSIILLLFKIFLRGNTHCCYKRWVRIPWTMSDMAKSGDIAWRVRSSTHSICWVKHQRAVDFFLNCLSSFCPPVP